MQANRSQVKPKKSLGQHFLHDKNLSEKIARALPMGGKGDLLVEIGPGTGMLTQFLLERPERLLALDVDQESIQYLKARYPSHRDCFHLQNMLEINLDQLNQGGCFSLIGNLPYNISSPIFFKVLENHQLVPRAVFLIQKEVADRIAAGHGNKTYGILSVLTQAYYEVELLFKVPPGAFVPPPKVQSAVLRLQRKADLPTVPFSDLKRLVKTAFNKRRKTLRNATKPLNLPEELRSEPIFSQRAEQLSVVDFLDLCKRIQHAK